MDDTPFDWPRIKAADAPVAVLVGPHTTSSGEMTAIAFRGRPQTRIFGAPTGGFTTGNSVFNLSDGAHLVITGVYVEDRNGVGFSGPIAPDEAAAKDAALPAARAWLASKGCPAE
jgi:C-terminal processing protease CtpA/Prc